MNGNTLQIILLCIVTVVLSIFLYLLNDKTTETANELTRIKINNRRNCNLRLLLNDLKRLKTSEKINGLSLFADIVNNE